MLPVCSPRPSLLSLVVSHLVSALFSRALSDDHPYGYNAIFWHPQLLTWSANQKKIYLIDSNYLGGLGGFQTGLRVIDYADPNKGVTRIIDGRSTMISFGGRDGPMVGLPSEKMGTLGSMASMRAHPNGEFLYFADNTHHRIRTINIKSGVVGTLIGGGPAKMPLGDVAEPLKPVCPGESTIAGAVDAVGSDAMFNVLIGVAATPAVAGRSAVLWACDWQNRTQSLIRRIDVESDVVTTPFTIPGHVVGFHGSATVPNRAYIALNNAGGSIFAVDLDTSNLQAVGAMNTGPLANLGQIRSLATLDDSQIYVSVAQYNAIFSLSTGLNPNAQVVAGAMYSSGDEDGIGVAARFGIVKHLCRSQSVNEEHTRSMRARLE